MSKRPFKITTKEVTELPPANRGSQQQSKWAELCADFIDAEVGIWELTFEGLSNKEIEFEVGGLRGYLNNKTCEYKGLISAAKRGDKVYLIRK